MNIIGIEDQAKSLDFKGVVVSLIVSAFAFVAALFWRDAISAFIEEIVPEGQGIIYQFGIAIFVTMIAVIAIYIVSRYLKIPNLDKMKKEMK